MDSHDFIKVEHLTQRFKETVALDDVSLEIPPNKTIGMIGPDGVGKSTLLSLITGARILPPEGKVTVLGGDMRDKDHRSRVCPKIAYMPQGLGKNLYFTLTVEENLQFFGRLFGYDAAERRRRIDRLTRSTGLHPFMDRPAGKLSGGMKQKLGLCCALIHDPDLLVLDEPTTGVDPLARRQFWDLIANIRKEQPQMGVVVATAYMDEAQRFDWIVAMDDGKILDTGTPRELLEKTGSPNLDAAFLKLLPPEKLAGHKEIVVPPLEKGVEGDYAIEAEGLTKRFGDFTAVDHVNFKIPRGEIFGFLGSNGCGKSTTMRMLTGLLPATEGEVKLFGETLAECGDAIKLKQGYMTQAFSLYGELTVKENLVLYAQLYQIPEEKIESSVEAMMVRFGLKPYENEVPEGLPMGIRQRLSLAAAVVHNPQIVILDEPTSGVDPVARDAFWELIIELSRRDKVTIFVTTHFMNEAERCDRISLMHCGKSLACDTPAALVEKRHAATLEEAFIGYLEDADPGANLVNEMEPDNPTEVETPASQNRWFNFQRWYTCCWRETLELLRDPIRLTLALFGSMILMLVMGFGITSDVNNLSFAVLDWDKTNTSRSYVNEIAGSSYFIEHDPVRSHEEMEQRMRSGELSLVIEIPPKFGEQLYGGKSPTVAYWIDAAMPSRAETINGYAEAIHSKWVADFQRTRKDVRTPAAFSVEHRYLYNPNIESIKSMVPAVIPLLLIMIPAILAALAIVREKEMGSIINLYVTPLTRFEYLLGKQCPYVALGMFSAFTLIMMAVFVFNLRITGNIFTLLTGLVLYCFCSTGLGLIFSSVTRSQIAVIFMTMIATMTPATVFCGLQNPVESMKGGARIFGECFPTTHMLTIARGVFSKGLTFSDLPKEFLTLLVTVPVLMVVGTLLLKKQETK